MEQIKSQIKSCTDDEVHDLTWVMLRSLCREIAPLPKSTLFSKQQTIPLWTGYNAHLSTKSEHIKAVAYAPIIDSKSADIATVYTTMKNCRKMCLNLGQKVSLETMDQQLYAITKQVNKWCRPEQFKMHIVRIGRFHTLSCFIAAIGKLWEDGDLRDLLADSDAYAGLNC